VQYLVIQPRSIKNTLGTNDLGLDIQRVNANNKFEAIRIFLEYTANNLYDHIKLNPVVMSYDEVGII